MHSTVRRLSLFFGFAGALAVPQRAEGKCAPHATIGGDAAARTELARELDAGGLVSVGAEEDSEPGCDSIRVRVERVGSGLLVTAVDQSGASMQRSTSSMRAAATVVEAWALGAAEGESARQLAEGRPSNVTLRLSGDTAISTKGRPAIGGSAAVFVSIDDVDVGLEVHLASSWAGFQQQVPSLFDRSLIATISYRIPVGPVVIAPELGLGAGLATAGTLGFGGPDTTAMAGRERLALRMLYPFSEALGFDCAMFALLQGNPLRINGESELDDILGLANGILSFGVTAGVWWRP